MHGLVFSNGLVALTKDLIFGLCVYGEGPDGNLQWFPWNQMTQEDQKRVQLLLDHNPTCPEEWREIVYA